jgi:hypothetical protein
VERPQLAERERKKMDVRATLAPQNVVEQNLRDRPSLENNPDQQLKQTLEIRAGDRYNPHDVNIIKTEPAREIANKKREQSPINQIKNPTQQLANPQRLEA